jgi:PHS family inorganic phosphate transporter-like MFS transporter
VFPNLIRRPDAHLRLTGVFSTLLLPETKGLTLEELSQESQEDFVKDDLPKRPAELQG